MIDRSKTRDIPLHPSAVKGRSNDWNLCRGNHLGQRSCANATIGRTYGRKRSDQSTAQQLARRGPSTYGVIDRSKTRDIPLHPSAVKGRSNDWNLCRGNHLGQRSCANATIGRTYGRKRSDQSTAQQLARRGPSTYGVIDRSKTRDIPLHPSAIKGRSNDWNLCRGNHLGQRSCANATIGRTYGRKRSDQSTAQQLARRGPSTYGVIDRSKTRDIPLHPSAVKGRSNDWNLCRGNHLGQRSCANATIGRTYGRKRSNRYFRRSARRCHWLGCMGAPVSRVRHCQNP